MRIWSLHPKYLDTKGLVALWRETLLAKHVLEGRTKGYKNHPQLERFKKLDEPLDAINWYLSEIHIEATARGYHFNKEKLNWSFKKIIVPVTAGQVKYESTHLLKKLKLRDKKRYKELKLQNTFETHPIFRTIEGEVEDWEAI